MEAEMDKRIIFLKKTKGYSTARFSQAVPQQNKMFN
jgi:hypothetical protein